jgi:hypothetical protein
MVEYALEYFEKYDIEYPSRIIFTGNANTCRKIIKDLIKIIDTENLTVLSTEELLKDSSKSNGDLIEDSEIFTRYSPLVQSRINLQEGRKCVVFDNIVYHPRQILPLFREVESSEDIIFLQSKILIETNMVFDTVFVVSYDEENIKNIHSLYGLTLPLRHFADIVRDCIDQGDSFVLKLESGSFSLNYYCEEP